MIILKDKKGFTLVEVLVSAVILGIVIISLLNIFVLSKIGSAKAKHRMKAMNLLRAEMEEIKVQDYSVIDGWIDNPRSDKNNVDNTIGTDELLNDVITTSVVLANNNLKVTVEITWDEKRWVGTDQQSEDLVTLISSW